MSYVITRKDQKLVAFVARGTKNFKGLYYDHKDFLKVRLGDVFF